METNNVLNLLESLHQNIYGGTADKKEVSKRRAKNKMARKQRKLNKKK